MNTYDGLEIVGQGQYGTVYKARHKQTGQLYCIKRISLGKHDDQSGALKEAQLLSSLDHPNIIAYKESFLDSDGALCIVTTYCEEGDLFSLIREQAAAGSYLQETAIMDMFIQMSSALLYIHSRKILHRDIKTQNIFLARGQIVKLGDFGICKVLEKTDSFATTVTGTPYYMSPEVCTNSPYTYKSDIWSLGCVLYEMCTLKHAFAADSLMSLMFQIVRGNVPPLPEGVFCPELCELTYSMLQREPGNRPSLQQIFGMPFVQTHLVRYQKQERSRLMQRQATLAKRPGTAQAAKPENGVQVPVPRPMTTKERLARKKEEDARQRALELKVASINMSRDKQEKEIQNRKHRMLYGTQGPASSSAGSPRGTDGSLQQDGGSLFSHASRQQLDMAELLPLRTMDSAVQLDTPQWEPAGSQGRRQQQQQQQQQQQLQQNGRWHHQQQQQLDTLGDSLVNFGTMPQDAFGGGGVGTMGTSGRSPRHMSGVVHPDDRPLPSPQSAAAANGAGAYGSPRSQSATAALGCSIPRQGAQAEWHCRDEPASRPRRNSIPVMHSVDADSSPLMGSVAAGNDDMQYIAASFGVKTQSHAAAAPPPAHPSSNGIKFGVQPPSPGRRQQPLPGELQHSPGAAASRSPMHTPHGRYVIESEEAQLRQSIIHEHDGHDGRVGCDDEDGAGAYSDASFEDYGGEDFEQYEGEEEEGDEGNGGGAAQLQAEVEQRRRIVTNVLEISRSLKSSSGSSTLSPSGVVCDPPADDDVMLTKRGQRAALQQRCRQELGNDFQEVYSYLSEVRADSCSDEREVKMQLLQLVHGNRHKLQACFLVDQLVYQDMAQ